MADKPALSLWDDKYYRYAGTCRFCGFRCQWVVDKKGMEWAKFVVVTRDNRFPSFMCFCEQCKNEAVFDLTGVSPQSNPTEYME